MVIAAIGACEAAFWVFLVSGLVLRYTVRARRASTVVLMLSPLADLALLVLVAIDLGGGTMPTSAHALAACYLGVTVAFGPSLVGRADARYAHRFAGGPAPAKRPKDARGRFRYERAEFRRAAVAYGISVVLLLLLSLLAGDVARARPLLGYVVVLSVVLVIWLVVGPVPAALGLLRARVGRDER